MASTDLELGEEADAALAWVDAERSPADDDDWGADGDDASSIENLEPGDTGPVMTVDLPPSWFDAFDDPVSQHDLFLRHLPELRLTATVEVPSISVSIDEALEPDGYRINVRGVTAEHGRVPLSGVLLPIAATPLLQETGTTAWDDVPDAVTWVDTGDSMAALLGWSPLEYVCHRVEGVALTNVDAAP